MAIAVYTLLFIQLRCILSLNFLSYFSSVSNNGLTRSLPFSWIIYLMTVNILLLNIFISHRRHRTQVRELISQNIHTCIFIVIHIKFLIVLQWGLNTEQILNIWRWNAYSYFVRQSNLCRRLLNAWDSFRPHLIKCKTNAWRALSQTTYLKYRLAKILSLVVDLWIWLKFSPQFEFSW